MNAAATLSRFALALDYLAEFIASVFPVWAANGCMVSDWGDGSLEQALQALRADDAAQALRMLALASEQASLPVGADEVPAIGDEEEDHRNLAAAQQERRSMALAARVATALTHAAMFQPAPSDARPAPADEDLEPLDFVLELDLSELSLDLSAPAGAASLNTSPQG